MSSTNRREARRLAMCAVYSMETTGYGVDETLPLLIEMKPEGGAWPEFTRQLCYTVERNRAEITRDLESVLENWRLDRVAPVERTILKLGAAEISYFADIPPRVTINEYIELAKEYANDNAPAFVNGVLDRLAHQKNKRDFKAEKPQTGPRVYSASGARLVPGATGHVPALPPEPVPQVSTPAPAVQAAAAVSPEPVTRLDVNRIQSRWAREIYEALEEIGGSASLDDLYRAIERRGRMELAPEWQMMVNGALERHSADSLSFEGDPDNPYENLFAHLGRRQWGLRRR